MRRNVGLKGGLKVFYIFGNLRNILLSYLKRYQQAELNFSQGGVPSHMKKFGPLNHNRY